MRFLRGWVSSLSASAIFFAALFSPAANAATPDRISGPITSSPTIALAKSLHPQAQAKFDQGAVEPSFQLGYITMFLASSPSQQKALDLLLAQQQDRTSPKYHKWLTAREFGDRFGASQNDMAKITAWLTSQGFHVLSVGDSRNSVIFSGTAAQVQTAFGTEIHRYEINGEQHIANSTPVLLPAALQGIVRSMMGLHDFHAHPASRSRRLGAARSARPDYYDANFLFPNFLAPGDLATIYDITPLYSASTAIDGTGQKLVILGQTDILLADINDFRSGFGLTAIPSTGTGSCTTNANGIVISPCTTTNFQYVLLGTDPLTLSANDIGEADLDIEWSGAVARNAQIIYINAETTNGVFDGLTTAIPSSGAPLATVISASYGNCEAEAGSLETILEQGNAEGVTILNSSGDDGAAACDFNPPGTTSTFNPPPPFSPAVGGLGVSYPASSPEVTGVGGTSISMADDTAPSSFWGTSIGANGGTALSYIPEFPWNDDEEFAQFCLANATAEFCTQGGATAQAGWVPITSAATAQKDIWISAGGGGASNCFTQDATSGVCEAGFPQPSWQSSVPDAPTGVRYVPDISMFASPDFPGYVFCTPQNPNVTNTSTCSVSVFDAVDTFQSIVGGTSAATPVFAGIVTLLNQFLNGSSTAGLGNINPNLYSVAAASSDAFHKISSGDNNVYCQTGQPTIQPVSIQCPAAGVFGYSAANSASTTGYNLVTGLGSVDANALFTAWTGKTQTLSISTSSSGSFSVTAGSTATVPITVTGTNGFIITSGGNSTTAEPLTYTCSGLPTEANCNFSPATTSSLTSITLSVTTAAPSAQLRRPLDRDGGRGRIFYALLLPGLFGIVFVAGSRKASGRGVRMLGLIVVLGASTLWLGSCGGNSTSGTNSNPGTPAGSYTVTVNATTGGANPIANSLTFTLVVAQ